jgi:hypothetical protein
LARVDQAEPTHFQHKEVLILRVFVSVMLPLLGGPARLRPIAESVHNVPEDHASTLRQFQCQGGRICQCDLGNHGKMPGKNEDSSKK